MSAAPARAARTRRAEPGRPPLRVVRHHRRRLRPVVAGAVLLTVASVFAVVAIQVVIVQGQFALADLERRTDAARERYEDVRVEVARLSAPARVVTEAETRLGMVVPEQVRYLQVPADAAPAAPGPDATASTLAEGWPEVKTRLAARP